MNQDLRSELETQGHLLETMRAEMKKFKGGKSSTGGGEQSFNMVCFILAFQASTKEGRNFDSERIFPKLKPERKG
jgi:hypothetical protein